MRIWRAGAAVALDLKAARFQRLNCAIYNSALGATKFVAPRPFDGVAFNNPTEQPERRRSNRDCGNGKSSHRVPRFSIDELFPRPILIPALPEFSAQFAVRLKR
jgi:hypothetical protein